MSYFLYESCRPIKGYCRSIIYDLQRNNYDFIPNEFHSLLNNNEITIENNNIESNNYINFLMTKEYTFKMDKSFFTKGFTKLDLDWYSPSIIENTIIYLNNTNDFTITKDIVLFFNKLNCFHIQIIVKEIVNINTLEDLVRLFENTKVDTIELIIAYNNNFTVNSFKPFCEKYLRIKNIIVYCSPFNQIENFGEDALGNIVFTTHGRKDLIHSGVNNYNFSTNYKLFTESQKHHTYFNRKLYIGAKGEIKNAPECEETFGNISEVENAEELKQIIAKSEFQKYWFVHKELCDVCKDCEFRHMCVDNRLPYQRKDESWYHKQECNYNPYICKWKDEDGYQTLTECGVISNENGFSIDHEKIAAINKELWEEETENA